MHFKMNPHFKFIIQYLHQIQNKISEAILKSSLNSTNYIHFLNKYYHITNTIYLNHPLARLNTYIY